MADLKTEFQARYSSARVIQLTNPDVKASSIDTARLDAAVADALAEFEDHVNTEYVETDDRHISVGVRFVEVLLIERGTGGLSAASSLRTRVEAAAVKLRDTSVSDRQSVATNTQGRVNMRPNETGQRAVPWSHPDSMRGLTARETQT